MTVCSLGEGRTKENDTSVKTGENMPPPPPLPDVEALLYTFALCVSGICCCFSPLILLGLLWNIRWWRTMGAIIGMRKEMKRQSLIKGNERQRKSRKGFTQKEILLVIILLVLIGCVLTFTCVVVMDYTTPCLRCQSRDSLHPSMKMTAMTDPLRLVEYAKWVYERERAKKRGGYDDWPELVPEYLI
jgi:hypothetical protein